MEVNGINWELYGLFCVPIIGAFIGWLTNYIAIKMLFRPRRPVRLPGYTVQGVLPKRQQALARKVGEVVAAELLSGQDIAEAMKGNARSKEVIDTVGRKIERVLVEKLPRAIPMVSMFLNPELVSSIKNLFVDEMKEGIDGVIERVARNTTKNLDVKEVVEAKVAAFSSEKLERLLTDIMHRELKFVELVGGVLGFAIGLVQVFIVVLTR